MNQFPSTFSYLANPERPSFPIMWLTGVSLSRARVSSIHGSWRSPKQKLRENHKTQLNTLTNGTAAGCRWQISTTIRGTGSWSNRCQHVDHGLRRTQKWPGQRVVIRRTWKMELPVLLRALAPRKLPQNQIYGRRELESESTHKTLLCREKKCE